MAWRRRWAEAGGLVFLVFMWEAYYCGAGCRYLRGIVGERVFVFYSESVIEGHPGSAAPPVLLLLVPIMGSWGSLGA